MFASISSFSNHQYHSNDHAKSEHVQWGNDYLQKTAEESRLQLWLPIVRLA
jgi:hypothetical protein